MGAPGRMIMTTKAGLTGWTVTSEPSYGDGLTHLVFTRDDWEMTVSFDSQAPRYATIKQPGSNSIGALSVTMVDQYLRGNRQRMSEFPAGTRVVCGGRPGTVGHIRPTQDGDVRVLVRYDDRTVGEPSTTHLQLEGAAA
ncbi:hypothetical protein [Streptosporangium sp. OZ121]|uniref:hypothetical protein n=1 Tax=Streptosporangium sp. OZ121 TaxID=3444183 RepID=UPI003F7958EA